MESLAGCACDVGAGEVGSAAAVWVGGAEVGHVADHGDVV